MSWWEALLLGLTQGASEFLPISSSGHLLLFEKLGVGEENLFFNVMLHAATLVAVLIAFRKDIWDLLKHPFQKKTVFLLVACIPTVAMALMFKFLLPDLLEGKFLAVGFMLTACLLIAGEKLKFAKPKVNNAKISVLTGVIQGIAVLPGLSRSGATIAAMQLCGVEKEEAANFSFMLSVPIILGSAIVEIFSAVKGGGFTAVSSVVPATGASVLGIGIFPLILGLAAAFISGLIAIKFFLKLIRGKSLLGFAFYDILAGIFALATVTF